jgi:soluble lytic murein transglycosylase-like protein
MRRLILLPLLLPLLLPACATTAPRLPAAPEARVAAVLPLVQDAARRHKVPQELILGVIQVESGFQPEVRSGAGARGLMQLMPRTAAGLARRLGYGEDYEIDDPAFNVDAGTFYLAYLIRMFDGDQALALAGYNSGPARVQRWRREGRSLPAQSRRYVDAVMAARDRFSSPQEGAPEPSFEPDRDGLRALIRDKQQQYGERPDEAPSWEVEGTGAAD